MLAEDMLADARRQYLSARAQAKGRLKARFPAVHRRTPD